MWIGPREKLRQLGVSNLSLVELLQIIIGSGVSQYHYKLIARRVQRIIRRAGDVTESPLYNQLLRSPGVGEVKAMRIVCALELSQRLQPSVTRPVRITRTEEVYQQLHHLRLKRQEHLVALYLNARHELVYQRTVFIGSSDTSLAQPRDIFAYAFLKNAYTIILAHNHPSGHADPSPADIRTTRIMLQAARWVGITILDHVIIGRQGFTSLNKLGYLTL